MVVFVVVATLLLPDDADSAVALPAARTCPSGEWSCYTADRLAVIGSLAGGGAWGAGTAVSACLWTRLMGLWD